MVIIADLCQKIVGYDIEVFQEKFQNVCQTGVDFTCGHVVMGAVGGGRGTGMARDYVVLRWWSYWGN